MQTLHESGVVATPLDALPMLYFNFKVLVNFRNGLFEGFFYIALGMCMGVHRARFGSLPAAVPIRPLFAAFAGFMFVSPDQHLPFCACAAACFFLITIRRTADQGRSVLRRTSTVVYLTYRLLVVALIHGVFGGRGATKLQAGAPMRVVFPILLALEFPLCLIVLRPALRSERIRRLFGF